MHTKITLLFSNIVGDVKEKCENLTFNTYMQQYLKNEVKEKFNLLFINANGLGGEENYLNNILVCFKNIGIEFESVFNLDNNSQTEELENFIKKDNLIIFLMGGNPYTQMELIKNFNLVNFIKEYNGLVIGFCAGALNLSKHSIITTDEDFLTPDVYDGIGRVSIVVESHYNDESDIKRNKELETFSKQLKQKIYAIPDESMIVIENEKLTEYGKIYYFE